MTDQKLRGLLAEALAALDTFADVTAAPAKAPLSGYGEHITVPRSLIGAACSAIANKRVTPKVLAELRRYTTGDLSAAVVAQQGTDAS